MILLLDVGNSRIKAASLENGQISPIGSVEHRGVGLGPAVVAAERLPNNVDRIVASCVAGPITQGELGAALADRFGVQAEFVTATGEAWVPIAGRRSLARMPEGTGSPASSMRVPR
jgi:pantothenate kinase type III